MVNLPYAAAPTAFPPRFAPPANAAHIKPYRFCVIDVETRNCTPDVIKCVVEKKMADWEPPANYKDPEKIAKLKEEVRVKFADKSAVWDQAPVSIITIKSDREFRLLHCLQPEAPRLLQGATVQGFATEKEMLTAFSSLIRVAWTMPGQPNLTSTDPIDPTEIAGHNVLGFDLPKLRLRTLVHEIPLARCLVCDMPVFDCMRRWQRFSHDQRPYVPLRDVLDALGIPQHKHLVDGAMVPTLIEEGRFEEAILYGLADGLAEEREYLMMSGQWPAPSGL